MFYTLDPETHEPVPCDDMTKWGEWLCGQKDGTNPMRLAITDLGALGAVSTVFLGIGTPGSQRLFETAIMNPDGGVDVIRRYAKWTEAKEGHETEVAKLKGLQ